MDSLIIEYKLSLYKELTKLSENDKSKIYLVKNIQDNKIYIKKVLTCYNLRVYEVLKEVNSKNIPKIYDLFGDDNYLIVIEEYIHGETLKEILEKEEVLDEERVIEYTLVLCDILEYLHKLDPPVIHRDIKPSNIIISSDDVLKLIDFDVSREYKDEGKQDTIISGTEIFAPPEQFGYIQTDGRSDIYSVGILMNVLTTGDYPKNKSNNGVLKNIIEKCIEFSPKDRYQTVEELRGALKEIKKVNIQDGEILKKRKEEIKAVKNKDEKPLVKEKKVRKEIFKNNKLVINERKKINRFFCVLPGFRSGAKWKMILGGLTYLFLFSALFFVEESLGINENIQILSNIIMVIYFIAVIFLYSNFLNIKEKIPIIKNKNKFKSFLGYILYTFILTMIAGALLQFIGYS